MKIRKPLPNQLLNIAVQFDSFRTIYFYNNYVSKREIINWI